MKKLFLLIFVLVLNITFAEEKTRLFILNSSNVFEKEKYEIVDVKYCTYFLDMSAVLIKENETQRFCAYLFLYKFDIEKILSSPYSIIPLEKAQGIFPEYNLTEENYGF